MNGEQIVGPDSQHFKSNSQLPIQEKINRFKQKNEESGIQNKVETERKEPDSYVSTVFGAEKQVDNQFAAYEAEIS